MNIVKLDSVDRHPNGVPVSQLGIPLQTNPTQSMPPQLCICLLKEVILTFLRDHLPLSPDQRQNIDTQRPRLQHPKPKKEQPSNPVEGAGASVKDTVLKASDSASAEALTKERPQEGKLHS